MIICKNRHFIALNFSKCIESKICHKLLSKSISRQNLGQWVLGMHTGQKFKICSHSKVSKNSKTWWDYIPKLHSKTINIHTFYPQNVRLTLKEKNTLNIESLQDSLKASSVLQLWKAIKIEIFTKLWIRQWGVIS